MEGPYEVHQRDDARLDLAVVRMLGHHPERLSGFGLGLYRELVGPVVARYP